MATEFLQAGSSVLPSGLCGASINGLTDDGNMNMLDFPDGTWINWSDDDFDIGCHTISHRRRTITHRYSDSVKSTSTPTSERSPDSHQRSGSLTDDSGFSDCSDNAALHMSYLYLTDDDMSVEKRKSLDLLPLPKLCLISKFDEDSDDELCENFFPHPNASCISASQDSFQERSSVRRQRSPTVIIERRSRHRLSLDAFCECRSEKSEIPPTSRRFSDSFTHFVPQLVVDPSPSAIISEAEEAIIISPVSLPSFNERLQSVLDKFSPKCLDRLIGRKMGLDSVDVVGELFDRSMTVVISRIAVYLPASDLSTMYAVSQKWKEAFSSDRITRERITEHDACLLRIQQQNDEIKENVSKSSRLSRSREPRRTLPASRDVLITVANVQVSVEPQPTKVVHTSVVEVADVQAQRFWKEASKLRSDELLMKCPRCNGPSKVDTTQERARCTTSKCRHDFCTRCKAPFHGSTACASSASHPATSSRTELHVGSKKSRQNLRRL